MCVIANIYAYPMYEYMYTLLQVDLRYPRTLVQEILWTTLHKYGEPLLNRWPFTKLREKALTNIMEHIHYEDENSQYIDICPINKVISYYFS